MAAMGRKRPSKIHHLQINFFGGREYLTFPIEVNGSEQPSATDFDVLSSPRNLINISKDIKKSSHR
ncbi:hypothetical protein PSEEN1972 [Pseudomonas entomophila L48]|uniref:Uncharacterized protein n=1 Tax=Pseudomonas entomophila (strain L48) TaxID=384676 RepID=Q1IC07_PSEE4|nr:hypothetical protein PSEEN1972 [Pseudomonas entomophila L48]